MRFTDEAITAAVVLSDRLITNHSLPDKAIDVIDDAGAYVKMKREGAVLPEEVKEARKRLKFIAARHESAVENNEFEKARFYFEEERTQREALAQLHLKHNIPERQIVMKEDVEEALARWTGMPIEAVREVSGHSEIESQKQKMPPKKKARKKKS